MASRVRSSVSKKENHYKLSGYMYVISHCVKIFRSCSLVFSWEDKTEVDFPLDIVGKISRIIKSAIRKYVTFPSKPEAHPSQSKPLMSQSNKLT